MLPCGELFRCIQVRNVKDLQGGFVLIEEDGLLKLCQGDEITRKKHRLAEVFYGRKSD